MSITNKIKRIFFYFSLTVIVLSIWLTGTTSGLKSIVYISKYTPYKISADKIKGALIYKPRFKDFSFKYDDKVIKGTIYLNYNPLKLFLKKIAINDLLIENLNYENLSIEKSIKSEPNNLSSSSSSNFNFDLEIKNFKVTNSKIGLFIPQSNLNQSDKSYIKTANGNLIISKNYLDLNLKEVTGIINGETITGTSKIKLNKNNLSLGVSNIKFGTNFIKIMPLKETKVNKGDEGNVSTNDILDSIKYNVNLNRLNIINKDIHGSFIATGKISSINTKPLLIANIKGKELKYKDYEIDNISGKIDVSLDLNSPLNINLTTKNLKLDDNRKFDVNINSKGNLNNHNLDIDIKALHQSINLNIDGKVSNKSSPKISKLLNINEFQWLANIKKIDIDSPSSGKWHLSAPTKIVLANDNLDISNLTLENANNQNKKISNGFLNLNFNWQNDIGYKANVLAKQIPLEHLRAFLPPVSTGNFDFKLKAEHLVGKSLNLNSSIAFSKGVIEIYNPQDKPNFIYAHNGGIANLKIEENTLQSNLEFSSIDNKLTADIKIDNLLSNLKTTELPISGNIDLSLKNLEPVLQLAPSIDKLKGNIILNSKISGKLNQPIFSTTVNGNYLSFELPEFGTTYKDIHLNITGDNINNFALIANNRNYDKDSDSKIYITGTINPFKDGFLNILKIKANNIIAYNKNDSKVFSSVDLILKSADFNKFDINGIVEIPKANISINDTPLGLTTSNDVVYVDTQYTPVYDSNPFEISPKIKLIIHPDVKISGLGLDANVMGNLTIDSNKNNIITAFGQLDIDKGKYSFRGSNLTIKKNSKIFFSKGGLINNPNLDIILYQDLNSMANNTDVNKLQVGFKVEGSLLSPKINLYSNTKLSDSQILKKLGLPSSTNDDNNADLAYSSLAVILGKLGSGSTPFLEKLQTKLGLSELNITPKENLSQKDAALNVGLNLKHGFNLHYSQHVLDRTKSNITLSKKLNKRLTLEGTQGLIDGLSTARLKYKIGSYINFDVDINSENKSSANFNILIEKD